MKCIISCEHASNRVPDRFAHLFQGQEKVLFTHQAYDPGAAKLARRLAKELKAPVYLGNITRLLVDLNRSPANRKSLFSRYSRKLAGYEREWLLTRYYQPYRARLERALGEIVAGGEPVLHISVHTFTPVKGNKIRKADMGLLYDPVRKSERDVCTYIIDLLKREVVSLKVRRNYPYLGKNDGFISFLRRKYPAEQYAGIEIEMNQDFLLKGGLKKNETTRVVLAGVNDILKAGNWASLK